MAQEVRIPRFYVDWTSYLLNQGIIQSYDPVRITHDGKGLYTHIGMLNPAHQRHWSATTEGLGTAECGIKFKTPNGSLLDMEKANWSGVLGHNLGAFQAYNFELGTAFQLSGGAGYPKLNLTNPIVNCEVSGNLMKPEHSGFSLCEANGTTATSTASTILGIYCLWRHVTNVNYILKFSSYCFGEYYDMPHASDLSTMSIEMDGVKNITTKGGSTLSNAAYTKAPNWGDLGAWQVGNHPNIRVGRRAWQLSFSYLDADDIMAKVASNSNLGAINGDYEDVDNINDNTLLDGSDFFSVVWNRTMGGHLPFIFNPNGGGTSPNNNPDQFAICRFDQSSLKINQTAPTLYQISVKIRECW